MYERQDDIRSSTKYCFRERSLDIDIGDCRLEGISFRKFVLRVTCDKTGMTHRKRLRQVEITLLKDE